MEPDGNVIPIDSSLSKQFGIADGKPFTITVLKRKNEPAAVVLKLVSFKDVNPRPELSGIGQQAGINYLTFYYDAAGFTSMLEKTKSQPYFVSGPVSTEYYQVFYLKDPDGIILEMFGPPASK